MAVRSSRLGAAAYSAETTFGDTSETTFDTRVPILGPIDVSGITWEKVDVDELTQYQNENPCLVKGVKNGEFTLRFPLTGLNDTTTGAISGTSIGDLLGLVVGNEDKSSVGGTSTGGGTLAIVPITGATFPDGILARVGAIGDARGGGQVYPVLTYIDPNLGLSQDMPAAANAGDDVGAMQVVYPNESPDQQALTSTRWLLQTANEQVMCWGCFPTSLSFTGLNPGELPECSVTFAVAAWEKVAEPFPSSLPVETCAQSPVTAGSLRKTVTGFSTPAFLEEFRAFELTINLETSALLGPGASDAYVNIIGAVRTRCMAEFQYTLDSEDAGVDNPGIEWDSEAPVEICLTLSASEGRSVAFYFPKAIMMGQLPMQQEVDGLNRRVLMYRAFTNTGITTSELTLSNWRMGIG